MKTFLIVPLLLISNFLFSQGEELWTTFITNSVNTLPSAAQDIIADDDGNVYVTSNYTGTIINAPSSISPPTNKYNAFIAKINSSGNVVWLKQLTGPKDDVSYAITLDHNKNVYVVGAFYDSLQLDGNFITLANHPATKQMYVLKLDTDGNFIWHYTPTYSTSTSVALDIEVDHNENCFVVGSFRKKLKIGNDTLADSPPATYENGIIFKLNPNGVVDWYQRLMGEYDDFYGYGTKITQICKAGYNEYYFGGNFVKYGQFSDTTFTIASGQIWNQDVIIGKIDNQGNFLWRHNFGVINPDSQACLAAIRKLVTNNAGELCMTGIFGGDDNNVILTIDTITMTSLWADEVFFSKFSPGGNCIWAKCVKGGLTSDIPTDLDITPEGNFLIPIEGSQTMIFIDTTTPQLFNRRVAAYVISGTDGRFISWDPLSNFPHSGLIKDLLSPQYCYDSYGNRYTFGKGTPDPPMSLDYQLYITKRSSDAVLYSGNVFHDKNLNASIDSGEIFLPHILIVGENDLFYKND